MLDAKLLEILACPSCRGSVVPDALHQWLFCRACGLKYRIQDGIPIMLLDEAEKWDPADSTAGTEPRSGE